MIFSWMPHDFLEPERIYSWWIVERTDEALGFAACRTMRPPINPARRRITPLMTPRLIPADSGDTKRHSVYNI